MKNLTLYFQLECQLLKCSTGAAFTRSSFFQQFHFGKFEMNLGTKGLRQNRFAYNLETETERNNGLMPGSAPLLSIYFLIKFRISSLAF